MLRSTHSLIASISRHLSGVQAAASSLAQPASVSQLASSCWVTRNAPLWESPKGFSICPEPSAISTACISFPLCTRQVATVPDWFVRLNNIRDNPGATKTVRTMLVPYYRPLCSHEPRSHSLAELAGALEMAEARRVVEGTRARRLGKVLLRQQAHGRGLGALNVSRGPSTRQQAAHPIRRWQQDVAEAPQARLSTNVRHCQLLLQYCDHCAAAYDQ